MRVTGSTKGFSWVYETRSVNPADPTTMEHIAFTKRHRHRDMTRVQIVAVVQAWGVFVVRGIRGETRTESETEVNVLLKRAGLPTLTHVLECVEQERRRRDDDPIPFET